MRRKARHEIYELESSPFAQRPTQREVGLLLKERRDDLRRLVDYKEQFIVRREEIIRGKVRQLAYPVDRLRALHERLKFHFGKVKQPAYLFSPRKGRTIRDNAALHLDRAQYLSIDLKKFYPSTTFEMIKGWFVNDLGMYPDVAGILAHLSTIDGRACFGSPWTPVLCSLVHRRMFDKIAELAARRGLRISVWVDDITISGDFVPGKFLEEIRQIIRSHGLKSHKIWYRTGNRPVYITGIGVVGRHLIHPNSYNLKIKELWKSYHEAETDEERDSAAVRLLSLLGTCRQITGRTSKRGMRLSDEMNALRMRRKRKKTAPMAGEAARSEGDFEGEDIPFN